MKFISIFSTIIVVRRRIIFSESEFIRRHKKKAGKKRVLQEFSSSPLDCRWIGRQVDSHLVRF
jgi:hypothetical protein